MNDSSGALKASEGETWPVQRLRQTGRPASRQESGHNGQDEKDGRQGLVDVGEGKCPLTFWQAAHLKFKGSLLGQLPSASSTGVWRALESEAEMPEGPCIRAAQACQANNNSV